MDVGEPDMSHVQEGSHLVDTELIQEDFFWSFYNTGIAIGTIDNAYGYQKSEDLTYEF